VWWASHEYCPSYRRSTHRHRGRGPLVFGFSDCWHCVVGNRLPRWAWRLFHSQEVTLPLLSQEQHFDQLFRTDNDPWCYTSMWAERRRQDLLLAMLDLPTYGRIFEPGCANGVFTSKLAARGLDVIALDGSGEAVRVARKRLTGIANVSVSNYCVPEEWPVGQFDLVVLSDFLYVLSAEDVVKVAHKSMESTSDGGMVLSCLWHDVAHDFLTPGGAAVHEVLHDVLGPVNGPAYLDSGQVIAGWRF
jgi:SAM-dependent methyltransferase